MNLINKKMIRTVFLSFVAGGAGMALDMWVFILLFNDLHMNKFLANAIAISAGTILSFIINIFLVFRVKDKLLRRFLLFYATGVFGIALSSFILWIGVLLKYPVVPVKYFSIVFVAVAQFFLNYFLAFEGGKIKTTVGASKKEKIEEEIVEVVQEEIHQSKKP